MYTRSLSIEQILSMLAETPPHLASVTAGVGPALLRTSPNQGEWSAVEVLAHMRSCADVWGSYIELIIAEERPTIRAVNPTTWIKQTDYPELEFQPSLDAFTRQRAELLAVLGALAPEDWSRAATITGAGKPREGSVLYYAQWLARHERPHVKQIERIVKAMQE